jgi:RHS repeat-associated protein
MEIHDGDGNITTIERDFDGTPTAIVGPYGQSTALALDFNGYLDAIRNPAGETSSFVYTDDGLLTSITDPNGNTSAYTYDDMGRLILKEDGSGGVQTLDRTNLDYGYEVIRTTALGRATTYSVEPLTTGEKHLINIFPGGEQSEALIGTDGSETTTTPDGTITTLTKGPDPRFGMQAPIIEAMEVSTPGGLNLSMNFERSTTLTDGDNLFSLQTMTDVTSINGRSLISEYDATTHTRTKTTPEGRIRVHTFNEQQRLIKSIMTGLEPMGIYYDVKGRLEAIVQGTNAAARELSITYNSNGFISSITDPMLRSVDFEYDAVGRITSQTLTDGREILFDYDSNGNIISITPPGQPPHNFFYTAVDRLEEYVPPVLGAAPVATSYFYNLDRQLSRMQRPDGANLDIVYDNAGRMSTRTSPRGTVSYAYDASSGKLSTIAAPGGETMSFVYDGSLLTERRWGGTITGSIEQTYDNNFHITSRSVNGANTIVFTYDLDGLLTQAGNLNISRDSGNGLIAGTTLGSATDSLSYNGFGERLNYTASYGGNSRFAAQYTRDKLGRITDKIETIEGITKTYSYTYDTAGRLIEVNENAITVETYAYDDNGNRLTANGVSAVYDDQDRLMQFGTSTFTYNPNGELSTKAVGSETTTYTYDVLGNLTRVILPDSTQIDYIIDGGNHRIGKKINGILVQGFLYKDKLNPVAELDGSGTVVSRFIYASKPNVPDYMIKGGNTYRIVSDHLGSPRLVIDVATGTTVQRIDYDSYGKITVDTNSGFQPFGFAGGLYDPDTQLTRFGSRDYDAFAGRWTAKDTILFAGLSSNLYEYTFGDPVNFIDPNGEGIGGAIVIAGIAAYVGFKIIPPLAESIQNLYDNWQQTNRTTEDVSNTWLDSQESIDLYRRNYRESVCETAQEGGRVASRTPGTGANGPTPTSFLDVIGTEILNIWQKLTQ